MRYKAEKDPQNLQPSFDKKQAAGILGVSLLTIDKYRHNGKLPSFKVGGTVHFRPADVYRLAGLNAEQAMDTRINALVADAPPLTDNQIEKLAGLINSSREKRGAA